MIYERQEGVPRFSCTEYAGKTRDYVVLIPIINEGDRIRKELYRAKKHRISQYADIVICDGGSTDGCTEEGRLRRLEVNTLSGPLRQHVHPVAVLAVGVVSLLQHRLLQLQFQQ